VRFWCLTFLALAAVVPDVARVNAAVSYPLTLDLDAQLKTGPTVVTSVLTIRLKQAMAPGDQPRAVNALKFGGYPKFYDALRGLPTIGTIALPNRNVEIQYAHEQPHEPGQRLVLVADRPLFFLSADANKKRAGYELTVVELILDAQGKVSGTMAGAARVKPTPDGGVILDDYAEAPVQLTGRGGKP
jgi:hypothetical protein